MSEIVRKPRTIEFCVILGGVFIAALAVSGLLYFIRKGDVQYIAVTSLILATLIALYCWLLSSMKNPLMKGRVEKAFRETISVNVLVTAVVTVSLLGSAFALVTGTVLLFLLLYLRSKQHI